MQFRDRDHPQASVSIVESHKTKTVVKIPTVISIELLDDASKPMEGVEVEVKQSNSSLRAKTDKGGVVKVKKSAEGSLTVRIVPRDQGKPADWSSKPSKDKVDTPKPITE